MASLTVPSSVFYGRRKRHHDFSGAYVPARSVRLRVHANVNRAKEEGPEYPPPPPFIPLSSTTYQSQLPALFHSFFAARLESGLGLADDGFDNTHSQIGPLGQIIVKNPPAMKKKPEVIKKPKPVKVVYVLLSSLVFVIADGVRIPGPGKGNWGKLAHLH